MILCVTHGESRLVLLCPPLLSVPLHQSLCLMRWRDPAQPEHMPPGPSPTHDSPPNLVTNPGFTPGSPLQYYIGPLTLVARPRAARGHSPSALPGVPGAPGRQVLREPPGVPYLLRGLLTYTYSHSMSVRFQRLVSTVDTYVLEPWLFKGVHNMSSTVGGHSLFIQVQCTYESDLCT